MKFCELPLKGGMVLVSKCDALRYICLPATRGCLKSNLKSDLLCIKTVLLPLNLS